MKRLSVLLFCLFAMLVNIACADNNKVIQVSQLPKDAQSFITTNLSSAKVALVTSETEGVSKSYKVIFDNGNSVSFNSKGQWTDVDCEGSEVPVAVGPAQLMKYVKATYPSCRIEEIEKDRRGYEVKLSNKLELSFDKKLNIVDIDK